MNNELSYEILGHDLQIVKFRLDFQQTVIAEAGAMLYMDSSIDFETKLGDGSTPNQSILNKFLSAGARLLTGESLFMTHFTQSLNKPGEVAFASPYPGTIRAINLRNMAYQSLIVQRDAFLCAELGTKVSIALNKRLRSGLFGGEGFIMQKLSGPSTAFIHAGGTIIEKDLENESILVDTGCLVAYEPHLDFSIERSGGLKSMLFGGEGLFLAKLSGKGRVWIQSLPIRKLVKALSPAGKNSKKEQRSLLGEFLEK